MSFEHRERLRQRARAALAAQTVVEAVVSEVVITGQDVPPTGEPSIEPPQGVVGPTAGDVVVGPAEITEEVIQAEIATVDALGSDEEYAAYLTELQKINPMLFEQVNSVLLARADSMPIVAPDPLVNDVPRVQVDGQLPAASSTTEKRKRKAKNNDAS